MKLGWWRNDREPIVIKANNQLVSSVNQEKQQQNSGNMRRKKNSHKLDVLDANFSLAPAQLFF